MSLIELLDKTRKLERLLHNNTSSKLAFNDICKVLTDTLGSNVLVLSRKGKILGVGISRGVQAIDDLIGGKVGELVDGKLNERLLTILSTKENVNLETLGFDLAEARKHTGIVIPIDIAGERLGTLFLYKNDGDYSIGDIILCEYGTTVVGLEMIRSVNEETAEESRKLSVVKSAIGTLSGSEQEAIIQVFAELGSAEGILVASKIADRAGITRSVIVNALRKFESAGIIESKSSGMKGTYIKILNDAIYDEIELLKAKHK